MLKLSSTSLEDLLIFELFVHLPCCVSPFLPQVKKNSLNIKSFHCFNYLPCLPQWTFPSVQVSPNKHYFLKFAWWSSVYWNGSFFSVRCISCNKNSGAIFCICSWHSGWWQTDLSFARSLEISLPSLLWSEREFLSSSELMTYNAKPSIGKNTAKLTPGGARCAVLSLGISSFHISSFSFQIHLTTRD